jgi:hypothetical protein
VLSVARPRTLRAPIGEVVDMRRLRQDGHEPTPRELRAALPRGWVLEPDLRHARRDARVLFREGWILLLGLVVFGSVGLAFLWGAVPDGWRGLLRLAGLVALVLVAGGLVAPLVTRALHGRRRSE